MTKPKNIYIGCHCLVLPGSGGPLNISEVSVFILAFILAEDFKTAF